MGISRRPTARNGYANEGMNMAHSVEAGGEHGHGDGETRRDFLYLATAAVGAVGVASAIWPFIAQMNPSADVLALSSTEVDISPIEVGQRVPVSWRGQPVFIHRRPEDPTKAAVDVTHTTLPAPTDN